MLDTLLSRLPEITPSENEPFAVDKLNRSQYAYSLCNIIDAYSDTGCVLSINGEWGTGKTTFVKMWQKHLKKNNYRTIYFNAWETDYVSDPLIALLGELKEVLGDTDKFKKVSSTVSKLAIGAAKSIAKHKLGVDVDYISEPINDLIDGYSKQKKTLSDFKKALIEYVAFIDDNEKTPVIFIIDELDRCNPHFAVKVLERVKHLFDIPNIIFVLPISKKQLEYSIQGFYGSDKIDAANYLRRFIDLEYELPKPDYDQFYHFLFEHHGFNQYFQNSNPQNYHEANNASELFKNLVVKLCKHTSVDLRTMDKVFVLCRLVATGIHGRQTKEMDLIFLLCFIKTLHYDLYCDIRQHKLSLQDLVYKVEDTFPHQLLNDDGIFSLDYHTFLFVLGQLLHSYNQYHNNFREKDVLPSNDNNELNLELKVIDREKLTEGLNYATSHIFNWGNIKEITDKIDLLNIL